MNQPVLQEPNTCDVPDLQAPTFGAPAMKDPNCGVPALQDRTCGAPDLQDRTSGPYLWRTSYRIVPKAHLINRTLTVAPMTYMPYLWRP